MNVDIDLPAFRDAVLKVMASLVAQMPPSAKAPSAKDLTDQIVGALAKSVQLSDGRRPEGESGGLALSE